MKSEDGIHVSESAFFMRAPIDPQVWVPFVSVYKRPAGRRDQARVIQTAVQNENGMLVTTYEHLRIYAKDLLAIDWGYAVLDEGHKIKNPDAEITLIVKQVQTPPCLTDWQLLISFARHID